MKVESILLNMNFPENLKALSGNVGLQPSEDLMFYTSFRNTARASRRGPSRLFGAALFAAALAGGGGGANGRRPGRDARHLRGKCRCGV